MCAGRSFDPWTTYHESAAEQSAVRERAKYRDAMKEEYRKIRNNPLKPPQGVIHDPAMQRWFSARVTYAEYLKPSKNGCLVAGLFFGAIAVAYGLISARRNKLLLAIENGEVDYKQRALTMQPR